MPTNEEIQNAFKNAKINTFSTPKLKVTALRDLIIETGIPDLTTDEEADYNKKVKEWRDREMNFSIQTVIRTPEEKPKLPHSKTKKKYIKKGETFETDFSGQILKYYNTNLIKGVDVAVEGEKIVNESVSKDENNSSVVVDKNNLPWIIVGALVIYLILK